MAVQRFLSFLTATLAGALGLAACGGAGAERAPGEAARGPAACPVIDSDDWRAVIDPAGDGTSIGELVIAGVVTTPTPGYRFAWRDGVADRSATPTARFHLDAAPPDGMTAQVVASHRIAYRTRAIAARYRRVIVLCGDRVLAEIDDVAPAP